MGRRFNSQKNQWRKGLEWSRDAFTWYNLSALEQSRLRDSQRNTASQVGSGRRENRALVGKTSPLGPVDADPDYAKGVFQNMGGVTSELKPTGSVG